MTLLVSVAYSSGPCTLAYTSGVEAAVALFHRLPNHLTPEIYFCACSGHFRTSSRELEATTGAAAHNLDEEHQWWSVFSGSWDIWGQRSGAKSASRRVVLGSSLSDPIQPNPSADWHHPTQPTASRKIWTQPDPTQYKRLNSTENYRHGCLSPLSPRHCYLTVIG